MQARGVVENIDREQETGGDRLAVADRASCLQPPLRQENHRGRGEAEGGFQQPAANAVQPGIDGGELLGHGDQPQAPDRLGRRLFRRRLPAAPFVEGQDGVMAPGDQEDRDADAVAPQARFRRRQQCRADAAAMAELVDIEASTELPAVLATPRILPDSSATSARRQSQECLRALSTDSRT